jgi:uncharacterized membrane protein YccC
MTTGLEGINAIGIVGLTVFVLSWLGAALFGVFVRPQRRGYRPSAGSALVFFAFGLIGLLSMTMVLFFGGVSWS